MPSIESYPLLLAAVAACEDKKAEDIRILALDPSESGLSDYFVICNGTNTRQNVAITDEVEIRLKHEFGVYPNSVEGRRDGEWVLMDYVDFILHVFSPEKREYYGLERLRKSATTVSPAELNEELKQHVKAARSKSAKRAASEEALATQDVPATSTAKKAAPKPRAASTKAASSHAEKELTEALGTPKKSAKASRATKKSTEGATSDASASKKADGKATAKAKARK